MTESALRAPDLLSENLPPESRRRACLIFNPVSGGPTVNHQDQYSEVFAALREAGIWAETVETRADESPAILARRAAGSGRFDLLIVAGGDGTVSEVAKGLIGHEVPLGIIAQGTFNNCARSLGLPVGDVRASCQVIARGRVRRMDVGLANDEHYFFEAAGVGIDAPLFPLGEELKDTKWWSPGPILRALKLFTKFQPVRVQFELDRSLGEAYAAPLRPVRLGSRPHHGRSPVAEAREFDLRAFLVVVANGPYYGSGFTVAPGAVLDDGLFTISVFRRFSKTELVSHFVSISRGRRRPSPRIDTFRAAELRLSSHVPLHCHVDGRPIGTLPLRLKVLPRALKVLA